MPHTDPLHDLEAQAGAEFIAYGPGDGAVEVADGFGRYEAEYAAIRRHVGIMHRPQRAVLAFTGADRQDFLHRMLTQDINALKGGSTVRAFQLNVKGRILADLIVHHGDEDTWLEMDRFDLPEVRELFDRYLFADDVVMQDLTDQRTALALHGPASIELLQALSEEDATPVADMPGTHHVLTFASVKVTVYRRDACGVPGFGLWVPSDKASEVYRALLGAAGYEAEAPDPSADPDAAAAFAERRRSSLRGRPVGWSAFNTARIEAGSPIFHIDFGHDSLPAETALLDQAVSFTKGCYLGQEIVARMHSLGHPRRVLVGLRVDADELPVAGTQVLEPTNPDSADGPDALTPTQDVIGGVTSSSVSPLLGRRPVVFAVLKWGRHTPGTRVLIPAEQGCVSAVVQGLNFLER